MSTTMPTTLPIPSRHPARLLRSKSNDTTTQATNLTSEQLDVWEHATVLYHGFDWQSSAETFLFLSRTINRNLESTLCLLNAAMIFARLGEYATASQILDEAEPNDQTLSFTMFLMGNVEFELGNFEKAEDCLKVSLHGLKGSTQHLHALGLDYTLRASHIQQSLRIFESKNELVGILGTLGALPADSVFEAPLRYRRPAAAQPRPSSANSRDSIDSGVLPSLTEDRSSPSAPASPIESVRSLEYASDGMQWHGLPENPDIHVEAITGGMAKGMKTRTPLDSLSDARETQPSRRSSLAPFAAGLRKARKSAFEPREARVQGDSIRGLADFIRTLPSQGKKQEPKQARVKEDPTTASLAQFFRDSGPDEAGAQVTSDNASDRSVYSEHSDRADSITSADLRDLVEDIDGHRATPPPSPTSRHPYRSGFGSMLLQENMPSSSYARPSQPLTSDALHDLLCDEDNKSLDWPLTDEASRSLRDSFVSAVSSRTQVPISMNRAEVPEPLRPRNQARRPPPTIPSRTSSLFRRQNTGRRSNDEAERPTSTVSSARFFSHVANLR